MLLASSHARTLRVVGAFYRFFRSLAPNLFFFFLWFRFSFCLILRNTDVKMNDVDDIKTVVVLQGLGNAGFVCMNIA